MYQHYEGNEFLPGSNVEAQVDGIKLWGAQFGGAHYGPVNFGEPGESRAVLLNWLKLDIHVSVEMKLDDGTLIGSVNEGGLADMMDIPPEVSGLHELIFTGKSAFVLFYHVHMCVQCEILVIWLLHLSLHCIHLLALATCTNICYVYLSSSS